MKKSELENAIKNGENVWVVDEEENKIEELHFYKNNIYEFNKNDLFINKFWIYEFRKLFATKQQAEHYLHHANVTRTETLPFLTWEEFDKSNDKYIKFINKNEYICKLQGYFDNEVKTGFIHIRVDGLTIYDYDYNEKNFYKAYDKLVKLFKGE